MAFFRRVSRVYGEEGPTGVADRIMRRVYWLRARLGGNDFAKSWYGPAFRSNTNDTTFRFYISGAYGRLYWDELQRISESFVFLDIGANQGLYTLGAASNPHLQHAYSFEPVAKTASLLRENVAHNNGAGKVTVVQCAISDENGEAEIRKKNDHSGGASIAEKNAAADPDFTEAIKTIDHTELDRIIEKNDLPIYVKIDVEGHEGVVVNQLFRTGFAGRIVHLFYEANELWMNTEAMERFLAGKGFVIKRIGEPPHYDVLATRT